MDSKAFLGLFEKEGDAFLNRTITTDFALLPKLKDKLKGKHFNDLGELRAESTIHYQYPLEWFDQVYRQWIET